MIGFLNIDNFIRWYMEDMEYGNMLLVLVPPIIAGFIYFCLTLIIAIILKFNKKVELEIKKVFYKFPVITIFIWLPMTILSSYIL